jgi:hypothetical protein
MHKNCLHHSTSFTILVEKVKYTYWKAFCFVQFRHVVHAILEHSLRLNPSFILAVTFLEAQRVTLSILAPLLLYEISACLQSYCGFP